MPSYVAKSHPLEALALAARNFRALARLQEQPVGLPQRETLTRLQVNLQAVQAFRQHRWVVAEHAHDDRRQVGVIRIHLADLVSRLLQGLPIAKLQPETQLEGGTELSHDVLAREARLENLLADDVVQTVALAVDDGGKLGSTQKVKLQA